MYGWEIVWPAPIGSGGPRRRTRPARREERLAGHRAHRREHPPIAEASRRQVPLDHECPSPGVLPVVEDGRHHRPAWTWARATGRAEGPETGGNGASLWAVTDGPTRPVPAQGFWRGSTLLVDALVGLALGGTLPLLGEQDAGRRTGLLIEVSSGRG